MDRQRILTELRAERDRLDKAIAALEAIDSVGPRRGGRASTRRSAGGRRRRHRLTPEGRKRLSEMMRRRWAERRKRAS